MRKTALIGMVLLGWMLLVARAQAQVQFGLSAGPNGLNDFYLSVGSYFNVPTQQVTVIRDRDIPDEQVPVVLFIAQRAHVDPQEVIELREEGFSWMEVALRFGIGPDAFYVNVNNPAHTPFGHAYGYYRHYDRKKWRHIRFSDDDIVNLVNLRFVSEYSHHTPDEVVRLRGQGRTFIDINEGWRPHNEPGEEWEHDRCRHKGWDKDHRHDGWDKDHHGKAPDDQG
ncbi:MAG TPA: hypothetical protein VJ873_12270, partial [bacterium]|nr:hypothetical protein [bacterium]